MEILNLIESLKNEKNIYIQTHNFPDHDAIASAFGLQELLRQYNIKSYIVYHGEIERDSLKKMMHELKIDAKHFADYSMDKSDKILIVDSCKGNKNVEELIGEEIGVIDHHEVSCPNGVAFTDIRPSCGSCSTIIYSYYKNLNLRMSKEVATALMIGINMDTALLTRGVSEEDIHAYTFLYLNSNVSMVNSILRNYIQTKELSFYRHVIDNIKIINNFGFCYFPDGCNQNLLGILGDFLLALEEVDFVVLCAKNKDKINLSVRSERPEWNASSIIQRVLKGIGFGGGHSDMAGGIIKDEALFDEKDIYEKFIHSLNINE